MPTIGKFAEGLRGFPTPETASSVQGYLLFYFPDEEWAQYVLGAVKALQYGYSWYQAGDVSVDDAAAAFRDIIDEAPYNLKGCSNPDGGKIIRIAPSGHVQQLGDDNTWQDTTGDYAIPPVPVREESDPVCLASANAANVLQQLYENVSDSFADGLSEAAAGVALISAISLIVGVEFAPITFAIVSVSAAIFGAFYSIMEFATADLWDEDFTKSLVCVLKSCASNDGGVITFDWECFNNALAAQVTFTDLSFSQLRLFGQIQYLLLMIGGVDALNLAGATTAITVYDCDYCDGWCLETDFAIDDGGYSEFAGLGGVWTPGTGWTSSGNGIYLVQNFAAARFTHIEFSYDTSDAATTFVIIGSLAGVPVFNRTGGAGLSGIWSWDGDDTIDQIDLQMGIHAGDGAQMTHVLYQGLGDVADIPATPC